MLVINSYTINQFDSYFDKLKISIWQVFWQPYDRLLLVIFNKINLQHLTCSQDFKVTTQLQLEIYYHVKKLTMEEKIIAAIQHILSKSTQRVISQRIFRFINKGAVSSGCELSQDCINGLEIDGLISKKKKGKNGSFFINPIAQDSKKKKMSQIMWKKLINLLNHLKQLKNWILLLTKFLEILKHNTNYAYNKYTSPLSERYSRWT